jgi:hypothetical protein
MALPFQLFDHRLSLGNVFLLGGLVTTTKRNNDHIPIATAVHAVAGARVDAELSHFAARLATVVQLRITND